MHLRRFSQSYALAFISIVMTSGDREVYAHRSQKRQLHRSQIRLTVQDADAPEDDLVFRSKGFSLMHVSDNTNGSRSGSLSKLDLFYAFDSAPSNKVKRRNVRRWLADMTSQSDLKIAHRFFSDAALPEGHAEEVVIQPKALQLRPHENVVNHWSQRWLFDLTWALENYDFDKMVRADDDGYQCPTGMLNLLPALPQGRPLMIFSSSLVPAAKHVSSKVASLFQWPANPGDQLADFEENWMLLDRSMASSLVDLQKWRPPNDSQILPEYLRSVFDPPHWPPPDSVIMDTGRFDSDENYPADTNTSPEFGQRGLNVWDSSRHGVCSSPQDCAAECLDNGLLWFHHVLPDKHL